MSIRIVLVIGFLFMAAPAQAQLERVLPRVSFSAVAVHRAGAMEIRQQIHYDDGRLRIEGPDGFATTILDLHTQSQILLMANHTYLVLPLDDELYRRYFPFRYATKLRQEKLDGIAATKYVFDQDGALAAGGFYWLTGNGIMVRRDYEEGLFGANIRKLDYLTDLTVGPVPAQLFSVPSGYKLTR